MAIRKNSGTSSTTNRIDKTLITYFTKAHKACAALREDLNAMGNLGIFPKTELSKLSKRVKTLDQTASIVLHALQ